MRKLVLLLLISGVIISCNSKKKQEEHIKLTDELVSLKQEFESSIEDQQRSIEAAKNLSDKYGEFITAFPKDSMISRYLLEQAILFSGYLAEPEKAVENYLRIFKDYPESSYAPVALFAVAEIYQNRLKKLDDSKKHYQLLIDNYPEHQLAKQAEILIQYVGYSDEELYDAIIKKSQETEEQATEK